MYRYFSFAYRWFGPLVLAMFTWPMSFLAPAQAANPAEPPLVGRATLVIGLARVQSDAGDMSGLDRGASIRVGDRIETGQNGHVHIRFSDGGMVSVRPSSRLVIEKYNFSEQQPSTGAIKFKLEEGVVRSITGAWGEAARERFRLNTPLAAIGVKGTDFVVRASADTTLATVYTGAIVLSPLQGDCQTTLGPCMSGSERLLSQDMKGQMVAISRQQTAAQVVPMSDPVVRQYPADANASKQEVAIKAVVRSDSVAYSDAASTARGFDTVAKSSAQPDVKQLVWARMMVISADGDAISKSLDQVLQMPGYQGTVGNFSYGLFRPTGAQNLLTTAETSANFRLAGGTAQLLSTDIRGVTTSDAAKVDAGTLSVDFSRSSFATQLQVSGVKLGQETLSASGMVQPNGFFRGTGVNTFTAGALSLDGTEAGYFFEKSVNAGQLRGITLWGR